MTASKNNLTDNMIEKLLERFDRGEEIDPLGQDILDSLLRTIDVIAGLRADLKLTSEKQTNKIVKAVSEAFKEKGIEGKQFYQHLKNLQTGIGTRAQNGANINVEDTARMISNIFHSDVLQTTIAQQKGDKSGALSYASLDTQFVQQALNNLSKRQAVALNLGLNNMQRNLISFFGTHFVEQDKKQGRFLTALVDAMANNKFVGGAFKDMVRLLGLMAASWVKNKVGGKLGGMLAGGTYILSELIATIVPAVIPALLQAGFTRLFIGPALNQIAKGAGILATGAGASLGLETVVGATATASSLGLAAKGGGILSASGELYSAEKIAELNKAGQLSAIKGANGIMYAGGPVAEGASATAQAINKNTSILSKIFQPLSKISQPLSKFMSSPLIKTGSKLLGPALATVGGGLNLYGSYKSFKEGDKLGGWLKGISGATGIASLFGGPIAGPILLGISLLTGAIAGIRDWLRSKNEDRITTESLGLRGTGNFPQVYTGGSASYAGLQGAGGRSYVTAGMGVDKVVNPRNFRVSKEGIKFIKNQEGFRFTAYADGKDKFGNQEYAVGWGQHKIDGKAVRKGQTITQAQADKSFAGYMSGAEKWISQSVKVPITQGMGDVLVDLYYNGGPGYAAKVVQALNRGDYEGARNLVLAKKENVGRRKASINQFWKNPYPPKDVPRASSQETVTIQTPSVSSTSEEVKAPEVAQEEIKAEETKVEVPELSKITTSEDTKKAEVSEGAVASAGLSNSIMRAILKGVDIPGNDTTFKVLTEMNNIALFGGQ